MFGQSSKCSKNVFFVQASGLNAWVCSDHIFQIAVISEYVSKFGLDPFSDLRDYVSKKERRRKKEGTKAVKYKLYSIAISAWAN